MSALKKYQFKAKKINGKMVSGKCEATSDLEAREYIKEQMMVVVDLKEVGKSVKGPSKIKVDAKDLQVFTKQLSVLVSAGIPLLQGIEAVQKGFLHVPGMRKVLDGVLKSILEGKTLTDSLAQYPNVFDRVYVNLISAGEAGGILDRVLEQLAVYIEKSNNLKRKIKGAMTYPVIIFTVAGGVSAGLLGFVVPSIASIFIDSGNELPGLTQFVVDLSDILIKYWHVIIVGMIGSLVAFVQYYKSDRGRKILDPLFLKVPLLGDFWQKACISKFSRTFSTLLDSGVDLTECLDIVAISAGNWAYESIFVDAKEVILKGGDMAQAFDKSIFLPNMVKQMIDIGEKSGSLDIMLSKVADFYEEEVDFLTDNFSKLLEPFLLIFLGVVVGFIVIAMYLPIFNLAGNFS